MSGVVLALPLALVLVSAAVIAVALVLSATPSRQLARPVVGARRHSLTGATAALLTGVICAVAVPAAALAAGSAPGVALVAAPVAFAFGHTAVLLITEATWPRQTTSVRAALLTHRSSGDAAPTWLRVTFWAAAVLVVATSIIGWATADATGRALTTTGGGGLGVDGGWEATQSPYPGALYALPALVGTAAVVVAVQLGLRLVLTRPAVPASGTNGHDDSAERALRRASGHRLLRGASTGLLVLAGGLLYVMGTAAHSVWTGRLGGVVGQEVLQGHDPLRQALGLIAAVLGGVCLLAAAAVLLTPAPRVPAPQVAPQVASQTFPQAPVTPPVSPTRPVVP